MTTSEKTVELNFKFSKINLFGDKILRRDCAIKAMINWTTLFFKINVEPKNGLFSC